MKINVLILASGQGSRFKEYTDVPKPLINVKGEPMYKHVLKNLDITNRCEIHAVFQKDVAPHDSEITIHTLDGYTSGPANSAYAVISEIHHDEPWLIVDCDLIASADKIEFGQHSGIVVENKHTNDPRASYSLIRNNEILCTAEKQVISPNRNVGIYYWSSSILFLECCEDAWTDEATVNGEYYISPLYNYAIRRGKKVVPYYADSFIPIGTPADLNNYLNA